MERSYLSCCDSIKVWNQHLQTHAADNTGPPSLLSKSADFFLMKTVETQVLVLNCSHPPYCLTTIPLELANALNLITFAPSFTKFLLPIVTDSKVRHSIPRDYQMGKRRRVSSEDERPKRQKTFRNNYVSRSAPRNAPARPKAMDGYTTRSAGDQSDWLSRP